MFKISDLNELGYSLSFQGATGKQFTVAVNNAQSYFDVIREGFTIQGGQRALIKVSVREEKMSAAFKDLDVETRKCKYEY